jgi:membrane protease YdiL (CAAX protease family)
VGGSIRRPIVTPILIGLAVGGVFMLGGLVVRQIPPLADFTENVLAHARVGSLVLIVFIALLNGVAEEIFFRGALYSAIGVKHPVIISTVVYTIATLASGNPMLGFAAVLLGYVMGLQRRASGGILAPILTHVSWSAVMVLALPPLFV